MRLTNPYPHCYWHKDRETWRVHLPGRRITLKREDGTPFLHCQRGTPEFAVAYAQAIAGGVPLPKKGLGPFAPDTFNAYGRPYFNSAKYADLRATTKRARRHAVEQFLKKHGDKRVTKLERRHVRAMLDDLAGKPGRQRNLLTVISLLIEPAVEDALMADPTKGLRPALSKTGWLDWPEEVIAQFEAHFRIGHDARLALGLGLYTAQRKSDVVRMGRQHVKNGWLNVTQQKNRDFTSHFDMPGASSAARSCAARQAHVPCYQGRQTLHGRRLRPPFQTVVPRSRTAARYSFHGLRKACLRRLADAGRDQLDLMAISGHKSAAEVQHYIDARDQRRRAGRAISRSKFFPKSKPVFPKGIKA
jgi:hypothetical protein